MKEDYGTLYLHLEKEHWWFSGRRDMLYKLIRNCKTISEVLEIGCSGGPFIELLNQNGFQCVKGIDISQKAINACARKGLSDVYLADACATGFDNEQFDIIIASDVLEHIGEEGRALSEWHRILKPGGELILFVPAFQFLWSAHDEANCHFRRYTKADLIELLERNQFAVKRKSYWNFVLFWPILGARLLSRLFPGISRVGQLKKPNPLLNKLLGSLLCSENMILASGVNFPFGVSLFAVAAKK